MSESLVISAQREIGLHPPFFAMNMPLEFDIYGHANSTHVDGSKVINSLGGSGDFFRNAYTPSSRRLKDGRTVSCVMPYVRYIDHTEHDIKCLCTEQGYAVNPEIRGARRRAEDIIEKCGLEELAQGLVHRYARRRRKIQAAYLGGTHRDSQGVVPMTVQQIGRQPSGFRPEYQTIPGRKNFAVANELSNNPPKSKFPKWQAFAQFVLPLP